MHTGQEAVSDSAHTITNRLIELIQYPHMMVIDTFTRRMNVVVYPLVLLSRLLFYEIAFWQWSISLPPLPPATPSPPTQRKGGKKKPSSFHIYLTELYFISS